MKLGISLPNNQGVDDVGELVALARRAEALGYDSVWVSEHLFHAAYVAERLGNRPYHEPLTVLAAAATETRTIALGTSVLVLPWHHPVRLAKTVATLDILSGGRVILGVGVGVTRDEFAALGVPFELRGAIADETIAAMKTLWTQEVPNFEGRTYRFSGLRFAPKPQQHPYPPLWIGGHSTAALRRVVEAGDGWHPLGVSPAELRPLLRRIRAGFARRGRDASVLEVAVRSIVEFRDQPWERPAEERRTCRGTPEEIAAVLRAYAHAGVTHVVLDANSGDPAQAAEVMERIREQVRPSLG